MAAEIGLLTLWLAFGASISLALFPALGVKLQNPSLMLLGNWFAALVFALLSLSVAALGAAFLADDFSVAYVANHSNTLLPWYYKLTAVWGSHEGSILFQVWILSCWLLALSLGGRSIELAFKAKVFSVLGLVTLALIAFIVFTSSPFERLLPFAPNEGSDLNPLLQDFGMIIHPPLLYVGYVGTAVAFAFAMASLIERRDDDKWAQWAQPWALVGMVFLSVGITIGSWWAYAELGWGGWWFWDPVENASLMPWLVSVALVHSLSVNVQRGIFRSWTVLLAISAFSLSLLGTFLVRSGVITSVHAFATDPERGMFILWILLLVVGGSLFTFALRAPTQAVQRKYGLLSREFFLLLNNLFLVVITFTVLIGTLWPLIADALNWGKISVGAQYFNWVALPIFALTVLTAPMAPFLNWKKTQSNRLTSRIIVPLALALVLALVIGFSGGYHWQGYLVWFSGLAIILASASVPWYSRSKQRGFKSIRATVWGMTFAHAGLGVCVVGVGMTSLESVERDVRMGAGEPVAIGDVSFTVERFYRLDGPNYAAEAADVIVNEGSSVTRLTAEKRRYLASGQIMTEAAVDAGFTRDVYVAMGEQLDNGDWAMRLQVKPFMRWVWYGGGLVAFGALLSAFGRRSRRRETMEVGE
ncbi:MAG: heme lyase CcmF/NrfE family subunit [Pseudomonadales bacterium]|jgi:cytochrome c-type biogenesis protein CcmF